MKNYIKEIKTCWLVLTCFCFQTILTAQTTSENHIKSTTYKVPITTSINNPTPQQATVSVTYFDGLGRPKQQISHKQSGSGKDIISHIGYDGMGRQARQYLPYTDGNSSLDFRAGALFDLLYFYSQGDPVLTGNPHFATATNPYTETFFEQSPLNRTRKIGAPGDIWKGNANNDNDKTIKFEYRTNTTNEVRRFYATTDWSPGLGVFLPQLYQPGFYAPNELYVTVTKDENWVSGSSHTTREYKDKLGRVILKRVYGLSEGRNIVAPGPAVIHDTYYVYDEYSNLTYVLTPLMDKANITSDALNGLGYQYIYDHRNRLVEKKLPGKQWEFIVYDKLNRPVATGPAYSPFTDITGEGWLITKYDALNRPVITGWLNQNATSSTARKSLQTTIDNQSIFSEQKTTTNTNINTVGVRYSNQVQPTDFHVLTINYFDDYNFPNAPAIPSEVEGQQVFYNNTTKKPIGLPTATWERALSGSSGSSPNEFTYFLYDKYANPIRIHTKNYTSGRTEVDSKFDFSGKVNYTLTRHKRAGISDDIEILESFDYTPQDRLLKHLHKINGMDEQMLSFNTYDELGQLIGKGVGSDIYKPGQEVPLQKINYKYNIRGWLTEINDVNELQYNTLHPDLFAFKINYTATLQDYDDSNVKNLYNGNIAETLWRSGSDNILRSYGYAYDPMNRLTRAIYGKPNSTPAITQNYDEWLTYDANGNILTLGRNGISDSHNSIILIDQLDYHYKSEHSNILIGVNDHSGNTAGFIKENITDISVPNPDFEYDNNGNLVADHIKNISSITYNHLNLPVKITFEDDQNKYIEYIYAATGEKLMKTVKHNDSISNTRYAHGFQYYDNVLQFWHHPEGYVKNTPNDSGVPSFDYVYQYRDHLGNIRVNYAQNPQTGELEILEESHYYPFGLQHTNYNSEWKDIKRDEENDKKTIFQDVKPHIPVANRGYMYKFNGMELQSEFGVNIYDFGFRNYDPALGRWMNIDPKAELMRRHSPYNYAFNNPIFWIDPDGMVPQVHVIQSDINGGSDLTGAFHQVNAIVARNKAEGMFDDTDYKLSSDGRISRIDENDGSERNSTDTLFALDDNGNVDRNNSKELEKSIINSRRTQSVDTNRGHMDVDFYTIIGDNRAQEVFEFVFNNSSVEWSITGVGNKEGNEGNNILTTSGRERSEAGGAVLLHDGYTVRYNDHGHPNSNNASPGDRNFAERVHSKFPNASLRIYFKGDYFRYNSSEGTIKPVNQLQPRDLIKF